MAAKPPVVATRKPIAGSAPPRPRGGSGLTLFAGLFAVVVGVVVYVVAPAFFIILATGMAPSVLALGLTFNRFKQYAPTLLALNFAGVVPVLARLWKMGITTSAAAQLLRDPRTWLLMFGAALFALLLQWMLPKLARTALDGRAKLQRDRLLKAQGLLVEEWGRAIIAEEKAAPAKAAGGAAAPAGAAKKPAAAPRR